MSDSETDEQHARKLLEQYKVRNLKPGQSIEPQCQCKCLAGAIGRGERDLASGIAQAQQNGVVMLSGHLVCSRRWMPHGYTRTGRIGESFRPPFGHQGLQRIS